MDDSNRHAGNIRYMDVGMSDKLEVMEPPCNVDVSLFYNRKKIISS